MNFGDSTVKGEGKYQELYYNNLSPEMQALRDNIPIKQETIDQLEFPYYLDHDQLVVYNPQSYILNNYKDRSIFESNVVEFWAPITSAIIPDIVEGKYWVSTWGRTWNADLEKNIGYSFHGKGYAQISCQTNSRHSLTRKLHRVILMTFAYFPGCENYQVNHIDCIRDDNRIYNLEWVSPAENSIYGVNHGNTKVFGNEYKSVLTDEQAMQIIILHYEYGKSAREIMDILNLHGVIAKGTVKLIWLGTNRPRIKKEYLARKGLQ